jgi:hypothetical protein
MSSVIIGKKEKTLPVSLNLKNFNETGEEFTSYTRPGIKVKKIILHWTGGERGIDGVEETLRKRKLGAHFIVDVDGTVQQYVDTDRMTWHAGGANRDSIGFEIVNKGFSSSPTRQGREEYSTKLLGKNVKFTTFTKEQIDATKKIVKFLCSQYNIPYSVPTNDKGELLTDRRFTESELANYSGVCGHYHVDLKKEVKVDPGIDLLQAILNDSKGLSPNENEVPSETESEPAFRPDTRGAVEKYEAMTQGRTEPPDGELGYSIVSKDREVETFSLDKNASGIISVADTNNIIQTPYTRFYRQLEQMKKVTTLELATVAPVIQVLVQAEKEDGNKKENKDKNLINLNELIFSTPSFGEDVLSSRYDFSYQNPERPIASIKSLTINTQPPSIGGTFGISIAKLEIKIHNFDLVNQNHPKGKYIAFLLRQNYHVRLRYGAESSYTEDHLKESFQWIEQDFFTSRHDITVSDDFSMNVTIELVSAEHKLFNQVLIGESIQAESLPESVLNDIDDPSTRKDLSLSIKVYNKKLSQVGINDNIKEDGTISSVLHGTITDKDFKTHLDSLPEVRKTNLIAGLKTIQSKLLSKKYEQLISEHCYMFKGRSSAGDLQYQSANMGAIFMSLVAPEVKKIVSISNKAKIKGGTINTSFYGNVSDNRNDVRIIFGNFNSCAAQWANRPISTFPINLERLFSYLREERDIGRFSNSITSFMNNLTVFMQDESHFVADGSEKKLVKPQIKFSLYPNPYYEKNGLPAWIFYVYDSMSVVTDFSTILDTISKSGLTKEDVKSELVKFGVPSIDIGTNYSLIKNITANTRSDSALSDIQLREANSAFNSRQVDASDVPTGISREFVSGYQLDLTKGIVAHSIIYPLQVSIDHYFMSSALLYGHLYMFFPTNLFSGIYVIDQVTHEISEGSMSTRLSLKVQATTANKVPQ